MYIHWHSIPLDVAKELLSATKIFMDADAKYQSLHQLALDLVSACQMYQDIQTHCLMHNDNINDISHANLVLTEEPFGGYIYVEIDGDNEIHSYYFSRENYALIAKTDKGNIRFQSLEKKLLSELYKLSKTFSPAISYPYSKHSKINGTDYLFRSKI